MKKYLVLILTLLWSNALLAQNENNVRLLLQSPDGREVRLLWVFSKWDSRITTGFDVRRREGKGAWVTLNNKTILPEIAAYKDLSVVESDIGEVDRLRTKMQRLIAEKKLNETDNKNYLAKLNSDPKAIQGVVYIIALDYDIALMNGFGYVDRFANKKGNYEYGLFIAGTDDLLAKAGWEFGTAPDLNIIKEITVRPTAKKGKVQLMWSVDTSQIVPDYIAGFNIYRDARKLNASPVMARGNRNINEFSWFDSSAGSSAISYSVSAITIFGIEGKGKSYTFDPAQYPAEYQSAAVTDVASEGDNFKYGIKVTWSFPQNQENFLQGFYVEKDNAPAGYKRISDLLLPGSRTFTDKSSSPVASYIKYRIIAVYKNGTTIESADKIYYYFPMVKPPRPEHPKGVWKKKDDKLIVQLSWDNKLATDTLTESYQIYALNPVSNSFYLEMGIPPILTNHYDYEIQYANASTYKFCISAISKYKTESVLSDTVSILVPSQQLPYPIITEANLDSNHVNLKWTYPDVWDLKGFRLYQNGNQVASEFELNRDIKHFRTPSLKWGALYDFTLQAVSESGVVSDISVPESIIIQKNSKK